MDYKKLQNGSDIRGIAIKTEGGKDVNLTEEVTKKIGVAFAQWTSERLNRPLNELRFAIGRDSRLSGEQITRWMIYGINFAGGTAFDAGMASTPAMFICCVNNLDFDAGIMITASHLPMERNGMKFFLKTGGLEKIDITEILNLAETTSLPYFESWGKISFTDVMTSYVEGLKKKILDELNCAPEAKPFEGFRIIVDAGNGAGGFFAKRVLFPLGADINGSRYLEPDGTFPNHQPNPENTEAMRSIVEAVEETHADMGIIFDTDVDRAGAVISGSEGVVALDRNRLIALMSAILSKEYGNITVVTDSITSTGLSDYISSLGCRHHRFKRGYRNVINEAKQLMSSGEQAIFAMETSGHGALYENYFLDDGAYIIVKLLIELVRSRRNGQKLEAQIADLKEPIESAEVRIDVLDEDIATYTEAVLNHVRKYFSEAKGFSIVEPNYEGVRVNADTEHGNGWFLIRRSLHDPIMPCNVESNSPGGLKTIAQALYLSIQEFEKLNLEPFRRII